MSAPNRWDDKELFAGYRLDTRLGQGGMGEVFRACKVEHGVEHYVALKRIIEDANESPEGLHYFLQEMSIAAQLQHTNIVRMLNFGRDESTKQYFLVLDLVEGYDLRTLSRRLREAAKRNGAQYPGQERGLLPAAVVAWIGIGVIKALKYAHSPKEFAGGEDGILHRDVSPDNIMLDIHGVSRLNDFGIAKHLGEDLDKHTRTGMLRGKASYASPEQCAGAQLDVTTDFYATGIVLFQLVTGKHPYDDPEHPNEMTMGKVYRATKKLRAPIAELAPNMPPAMQALLEEILQPDRDERPRADEIIERLKLAALQALGKRKDGRPYDIDDAQKWAARLVRSVYAARTAVEMRAIRPEDLEGTPAPKSHKRLIGQEPTKQGYAPAADSATAPNAPTAENTDVTVSNQTAPLEPSTAPMNFASTAPLAVPSNSTAPTTPQPEPSRRRTLVLALAVSTAILAALLAAIGGFALGGFGEQDQDGNTTSSAAAPVEATSTTSEPPAVDEPSPPHEAPPAPIPVPTTGIPEAADREPAASEQEPSEPEAEAEAPVLLTVHVEPFGPLWVDGDRVIGPNQSTARVRLTPGRHRVLVGPRRESHSVTVRPGRTNAARFLWLPQ